MGQALTWGLFSTAYVAGLAPASDPLSGNYHGDFKTLGEKGQPLQRETGAEGGGSGQRVPLLLSGQGCCRPAQRCRSGWAAQVLAFPLQVPGSLCVPSRSLELPCPVTSGALVKTEMR